MTSSRVRSHFPHLVLCREKQFLPDDDDVFPDRLLHGGDVAASLEERLAVMEALRWPSLGAYTQLAFAPPHEQQVFLSHFPLSDDELLAAFQRIRAQRLVVTVARGIRVRQIRDGQAFRVFANAPLVQGPSGWQAKVAFQDEDYQAGERVPLGPLVPQTEYLVDDVAPWDGMMFERACEAAPQMPDDRAQMIGLAVAYSCLGEPWRPDGSVPLRTGGAPLSRFVTFPSMVQGALWAAASREAFRTRAEDGLAVVWRMLAEAFVEVVRALRVDFATTNLSDGIRVPAPKEGKHWGAWLPPESWNRIRLQSVVLSRVQRLVRRRLLPESGYQKRGYPAHRRMREAWSPVPGPRRSGVLRAMRIRLTPPNYLLFRAALRGLALTQVVTRQRTTKTALSERLHKTVIPTFFGVLRYLGGPGS